jgi:hypothetical protein
VQAEASFPSQRRHVDDVCAASVERGDEGGFARPVELDHPWLLLLFLLRH